LWDEPQTASLEAYTRPEILSADLSSLVLDLAHWGLADTATLAFLDPPPLPALTEARALLRELDAIDETNHITSGGNSLRALALPPRLARMIVESDRLGSGVEAAMIAAILTERGLGGDSVDLDARLDYFRRDRSQRAVSARQLAQRWAGQVANATPKGADGETSLSTGIMLALAFPDRVARNRGNGSFVLANGRGASIDQTSALARAPYVSVAELTGTAANGRILLAAPITQEEIEAEFYAHIEVADEITFDRSAMALRARRRKKLHAITLSEQPLSINPSPEAAKALADGLVTVGLDRLPWSKPLKQWRDRVMFLRAAAPDEWPDLSDKALAETRDDWLVPALLGKTSLAGISAGDLSDALMGLLPWELRARLDREAPTHFDAPTGTSLPIDYEAEQGPTIAVRLQELFGLNAHPSIAKGKIPLVLELLSPAHRPVQVTRDLPGFWRGSYAAVRSDLRGRYPRHPWPEDPATAMPTRRVKPRGT
jgi:ATP-dependent helicase HrpB